MEKKKFKSAKLVRSMGLELVSNQNLVEQVIDKESRIIVFSFSSEQPVERDYIDPDTGEVIRAYEVLDHSGDVRLDRLRKAGNLFVNHNKNDLVGVVEDAWCEANRGLVKVRFGESGLATEIYNDVLNGIRRNVSFGYRTLEADLEFTKRGDLPTMRIKSFEPYEVSLETIPADITVGVGRSDETAGDDENEFMVTRNMEETKKGSSSKNYKGKYYNGR